MEKIEVDVIDNITCIAILNGITKKLVITKEDENVLDMVCEQIRQLIYDCGKDKYMLEKNRIIAGEYKKISSEYDKLFNNGKINSKDIFTSAYDAFDKNLKNSVIIYFDNKPYEVCVNGESNPFEVLKAIYDRFNIEGQYCELDEYMSKSKGIQKILK